MKTRSINAKNNQLNIKITIKTTKKFSWKRMWPLCLLRLRLKITKIKLKLANLENLFLKKKWHQNSKFPTDKFWTI